jgi:hypothetical protein
MTAAQNSPHPAFNILTTRLCFVVISSYNEWLVNGGHSFLMPLGHIKLHLWADQKRQTNLHGSHLYTTKVKNFLAPKFFI